MHYFARPDASRWMAAFRSLVKYSARAWTLKRHQSFVSKYERGERFGRRGAERIDAALDERVRRGVQLGPAQRRRQAADEVFGLTLFHLPDILRVVR
jgi:hypothetical protein